MDSTTTTHWPTTLKTYRPSYMILPKSTSLARWVPKTGIFLSLPFCLRNSRVLPKVLLSSQHKYPASCLDFKYDPKFPIRGLYFDRLKGNLLKLDFFGSIEADGCYFGRRKVILKTFYSFSLIRPNSGPNHLVTLARIFCGPLFLVSVHWFLV